MTVAYSILDEISEGFRRKLNGGNDYDKKNANKIISYLDDNRTIVAKKLDEYTRLGLSYADKDFYILVRGNEVQMPLDYKAYAKVVVQSANSKGYDVIIEADVIREGYKGGYLEKQENGDEVLVINNPITGDIAMPWAKYKIISQKTHEIVSSKIEVVPHGEYVKAKQSGGANGSVGQIHQNYATEGAKKIAVRRITKHLAYIFPELRNLQIVDDDPKQFDDDSIPVPTQQNLPTPNQSPKRPSMEEM